MTPAIRISTTFTFNCMYIFENRLLALGCSATALLLCLSCSGAVQSPSSEYDHYWVVAADGGSKSDIRHAKWLVGHINHRARGKDVAVAEKPAKGTTLQIVVNVDKRLPHDYSSLLDGNRLTLSACDDEKMLWLMYQFMSGCEDNRMDVSDLPPSFIDIRKTQGDFAFEYRGIYSPSNSDPDLIPVTASGNVDYDWGLWGHNLKKVFNGGIPAEAFALTDGKRTKGQFCFSSEKLYKALEAYIIDNYGYGNNGEKPVRFAIMPEDNPTVCLCKKCKAAGNTMKSATPAVTKLLTRLAKRFPNHQFFTSSYLSTTEPPTVNLPDNAGVIISAMDLPMEGNMSMKSAKTADFIHLIDRWSKATSHIYVWDYMRNFDDYLTPWPCLAILRKRLQFFHSLGVKGMFYNGSGYDYASFDDVQTAILAALLIKPDLNVEEYVNACLQRWYPETGKLLASAYLLWEHKAVTSHVPLQFYGGIGDAVRSWLNPDEFDDFCIELDRKAKHTDDSERARLNKLLTALQFTRLELMRMPHGRHDAAEAAECLESLKGHTAFKDMSNYRETNGSIDTYIKEWESMKSANSEPKGRIDGVLIQSLSPVDEGYEDLSVLTDGRHAMPSDYHTGWIIASNRHIVWQIPSGKFHDEGKLIMSFLYAPKWHIQLPKAIEVRQGEKLLAKIVTGGETSAPFTRHEIECMLQGVNATLPIELRITQTGKGSTVACDEIKIY